MSKHTNNFEIRNSTEFGRILVTSKPLKKGDIIFNSEPFLIAPLNSNYEKSCFVCFGPIFDFNSEDNKCILCESPLCSIECQYTEEHQKNCNFFRTMRETLKNGISIEENEFEFAKNIPKMNILLILKLLFLQQENLEKWASLKEFCKTFFDDKFKENEDESELKAILKLIKKASDSNNLISKNILEDVENVSIFSLIFSVLNKKSFEIRHKIYSSHLIRGVYSYTNLLSHDCIEDNSFISVTNTNEPYSIVVRASKDIPEMGTRLKFNFANPLISTRMRRQLLEQRGIEGNCFCKRCSDPEELGAFMASIKCSNTNCRGPVSPHSKSNYQNASSESESWKCAKCNKIFESESISKIIDECTKYLGSVDRFSRDQVEESIKKLSSILHPKHAFLIELKHCLVEILARENQKEMCRLSLSLERNLLKELLDLTRIVSPSINRFRGIICLHLFNCEEILNPGSSQNAIYLKECVENLIYETEQPEKSACQIALCELKRLKGAGRI